MPKRYKTKRRKTGRRKKSIFKGFLFPSVVFSLVLVLSAAGFILFSPRFQITNVSVSGNSDIPSDQLQKVASATIKKSFSVMGMDFSTESIFLSAAGGVGSLLKAFPEIESVSVKKNFPNGLSIQVVEKTPFALWCEEFDKENCYLVDKSGSYIKDFPAGVAGAPGMRINEKEKSVSLEKKDVLASIVKIESGISTGQFSISDFNLFKDKLTADTSANCQLIFVLDDTLDWQIEKLNIVLKNEQYSKKIGSISYIDLRFGNQAIIK